MSCSYIYTRLVMVGNLLSVPREYEMDMLLALPLLKILVVFAF